MSRTAVGGSRQTSHRAGPNHIKSKPPWARAVSGHRARSFGPSSLTSAQAQLPSPPGAQPHPLERPPCRSLRLPACGAFDLLGPDMVTTRSRERATILAVVRSSEQMRTPFVPQRSGVTMRTSRRSRVVTPLRGARKRDEHARGLRLLALRSSASRSLELGQWDETAAYERSRVIERTVSKGAP